MEAAREKVKTVIKGQIDAPEAFLKWILLSVLAGSVIGTAGAGFLACINLATSFRKANPWLVWLLPAAGLLIVFLYRASGVKKSQGTNLVLLAVRSPEPVPFKMAPLIFISTVLTHLFGGSAGREGAALQMGGSLGFSLGRLFRLDEKDLHIMTMCGMSAAFSALFGTPLAAAVFAMEVVSVGVMYYAALVPCTVASLIASCIAHWFGILLEAYRIIGIPAVAPLPMLKVALLAALCAVVSILFCTVLRKTGRLCKKVTNPYLRAVLGGLAVAILTLVFGTDYLGTGMDGIAAALHGTAKPEAFLIKLLFTALTLGVGFKGGEIVPGLFVGAAFGCTMAGLVGLNPAFGAALGMLAVFCGVTNCPLTTLVLGVELFGAQGAAFYLLASAVSYMLSGYTGLYSKQKILYSKYKPEFLGTEDS